MGDQREGADASALKEEEFVRYAQLKGLSDTRILSRYILPNALLPQITFLALQIGLMFNGSIDHRDPVRLSRPRPR